MKKIFLCFLFFFIFFNIKANSVEDLPIKLDYEQVINVGKMLSHDKKFTLFFKTREKAILAKGIDANYIRDYPQDLYYLHHDTGKTYPLISYDWFPKKVKELGTDFGHVYHSVSMQEDPKLSEFVNWVGQTGCNLLDTWGVDMSNHDVAIHSMWVQEFAKDGGGHHRIHIHENCHISGFFFLEN